MIASEHYSSIECALRLKLLSVIPGTVRWSPFIISIWCTQ